MNPTSTPAWTPGRPEEEATRTHGDQHLRGGPAIGFHVKFLRADSVQKLGVDDKGLGLMGRRWQEKKREKCNLLDYHWLKSKKVQVIFSFAGPEKGRGCVKMS